ncbi:DUF488 domain-containing protein [Kitasatospora sp. NPDC101801]|uniref:DUF488 domain-containing protein n=1 Tax=Kitasatospora sp. NPDC101801 TaxID=3364103 RepID=UPI00381CFC26
MRRAQRRRARRRLTPRRSERHRPSDRTGAYAPLIPAIHLGRVHNPHRPEDGARILVAGRRPRGLSKERAALDGRPKPLTPSTELRRWHHGGGDFPTFRTRYLTELAAPEAQAELASLHTRLAAGPVVLLTAAKDLDHSHAAVLRELLTHPPATPCPLRTLTVPQRDTPKSPLR